MTKTHILILVALAAGMLVSAIALGNWAAQINPDGIAAHPVANTESEPAAISNSAGEAPRDAFSFGVSMGLLATGLLYCCIAFGLLIRARSQRKAANPFIYWVAGLAGLGFVLSYLVDDYFY